MASPTLDVYAEDEDANPLQLSEENVANEPHPDHSSTLLDTTPASSKLVWNAFVINAVHVDINTSDEEYTLSDPENPITVAKSATLSPE